MPLESLPIASAVVTPLATPIVANVLVTGGLILGGAYLIASGIRKVRDKIGEAIKI